MGDTERTERIKITFDVPDKVRRALAIAAGSRDKTVGQVIEWMAEQLLTEEMEFAARAISRGDPEPKGKPGRKRRPPSTP
jgi:hypothetical protein